MSSPVRATLAVALAIMVGWMASCSPGFVVRAAWEEAGILLRRQDVDDLIRAPETPSPLREKFQLVLQAREFAQSFGLEPEGSYTKYSRIDRDVLLWVLVAAPKHKLEPVTWWFPFVGSVPYKGYFDKDDATSAAERLSGQGFDTYLRPSAAFSTLGWFDDPLLSTVLQLDENALVNTVLHEIVHNTLWIQGSAEFNETLANFVGSRGAIEFFEYRDGPRSVRALHAEGAWRDEIALAHFVDELFRDLAAIYGQTVHVPEQSVLSQREKALEAARARWLSVRTGLCAPALRKAELKMNNASLLAHRTYLDRLWLFDQLYLRCGGSLSNFMREIKKLARDVENNAGDPYALLERYTGES